MRAQTTREHLQRAFNDAVERNGRGHAVAALEGATGTMFYFEVRDDKISAAFTPLLPLHRRASGTTG